MFFSVLKNEGNLDIVSARTEGIRYCIISRLGTCEGFVLIFCCEVFVLFLRKTCPIGGEPEWCKMAGLGVVALATTWWHCSIRRILSILMEREGKWLYPTLSSPKKWVSTH